MKVGGIKGSVLALQVNPSAINSCWTSRVQANLPLVTLLVAQWLNYCTAAELGPQPGFNPR